MKRRTTPVGNNYRRHYRMLGIVIVIVIVFTQQNVYTIGITGNNAICYCAISWISRNISDERLCRLLRVDTAKPGGRRDRGQRHGKGGRKVRKIRETGVVLGIRI